MTYEQRRAFIGGFLRERVMPRYKRPEHFDDATARREIADIVADLTSEWPVVPDGMMAEIAERFFANLRKQYSGRTWPPIAAMVKALKHRDEPESRSKPGPVDYEAIRRAQLAEWLRGGRPIGRCFVTRERLEAIGATPAQVSMALAFAGDAGNQGVLRSGEP